MSLNIKGDTFVLESNIHFPTDLNLLYDSARKSLDVLARLVDKGLLKGWQKHRDWQAKIRRLYLKASNIHRKKGRNYAQRLKTSTQAYLLKCRQLNKRLIGSIAQLALVKDCIVKALKEMLVHYQTFLGMLCYCFSQVSNRIILSWHV